MVKTAAILTIILASAFSAFADFPTIEGLTSHLFTNAVIVWQAPTNELPRNFWIYQRTLPRVFSERVISKAIVLGSLQQKALPRLSTKDFYIPEDLPPNWPGPVPVVFGVQPDDASLFYEMPGYAKASDDPAKDIPTDRVIAARAWKYARQLGLDTKKMALKNFYTHFCNADQNQDEEAHGVCGRGVFLSRELDGIPFFSADEQGDGAEGFSVEFGGFGKTCSFSLCWSDVQRCESLPTDDPRKIIHNIQMHKILVLPDANETDYFTRLKKLASATKVVVTRITPYYFKGVFGQVPTSGAPAKLITPMAQLEAIADCGDGNIIIRMVTPIIP